MPRDQMPSLLLAALAVGPALVVTAWLVAAFPVVWMGHFRPYTVGPLFVVLAVLMLRFGLPPVLRTARAARAPWWALVAVLVIVGTFMVFAAATHSEQVVLHRDNGSYAQIGYQLAHDGKLTKSIPVGAFGDSASAVSFNSPAFFQVGDHLVPQFMTGWPTMVAAGWWVGGWSGELVMPALVGALALLAIAGLAARLVGPRWAPLAALVTAVAFPVLKNSQTTFSEMPALLLLMAGVYLLGEFVVAGSNTGAGSRSFVFVAGLVLGVGELVRLDLALELALLMPVLGWLWATRRTGVGAYMAGAVAGLVLGALDARFLSWPYVHDVPVNWSSVKLVTLAFVLASGVSFGVAAAVRRWGVPAWLWRWVPVVGASVAGLIGVVLLVRPYVSTAHGDPNSSDAQYLTSLQAWVGLTPDGSRTYAEQSLRWVSWYVGWPLVVAALVGGVLLTWRVLRGGDVRWAPALPVYLVSAALQLWRPSITPDHPYADRRLVTVVLPGFILLAVWAVAAATRAIGERVRAGQAAASAAGSGADSGSVSASGSARRSPVTSVAVATLGAAVMSAALVVPAASASAPVAAKRTELGEVAASNAVCRSLSPKRDSVVLIDGMSGQWMATIRNQCRVPVALLTDADAAGLAQVAADIVEVGRRPVIAASGANPLQDAGYTVEQLKKVVVLSTRQDQQQIVKRPTGTKQQSDIEFWYTRPTAR
ncbi:hypothetical protein GCM10009839_10710 [Catenulispora yoronensis]|uniref:Uncharacterized protein n=1 Tax=Catenulispora yoronensis TaxID=450799 RepID=A0ABP5F4H9_9ACTN